MELSTLGDLVVWIGIGTLCLVHLCFYKATKRVLAGWLEDDESAHIFLDCPLPWWMNLAVFHFSFFFTAVLIWLTTILLS